MALSRNVLANLGGQGLTALLALVFTPVYVRQLGIEGYGLIGIYTLVYSLTGLIDTSVQAIFTRAVSQARGGGSGRPPPADLLRSFEWPMLCISVVFAGLGMFLGPLAATYWLQTVHLDAATVTHSLQLIGLLASLRFLEGLYRAGLMGLERQGLFNVIHGTANLVRWGGAAVVVTWVEASVIAFFLWQTAASAFAIALLSVSTRRACGTSGHFRRAAHTGLRRFAAGMIAIGLTAVLLTQTTPLILSYLLPLNVFGIYSLASMAAAAVLLLAMPVGDAFFPRLCALQGGGDPAGFAHTFHLGAQTLAVIVLSAGLTGILHARPLLELWLHDAALAADAAPITQLLLFGNLLNAFMSLPYRAQLAHGWAGLTVRINIAAILVLLPATFIVVPLFGAIGAAALWMLLNAGYLLIGVHWMFRRILVGEKWRWYRDSILAPGIASVSAAAAANLAFPDPAGTHSQLLAVLATGGLALVAAATATPTLRQEIGLRLRIAKEG
ncbi:MAG TPA: hypothetical protein DCY89_05785 [Gammaproteobacteria bacterium]|nr:hypothetical protein [Gammaproteobacteria bacterium]